jgi:hypothetical protein
MPNFFKTHKAACIRWTVIILLLMALVFTERCFFKPTSIDTGELACYSFYEAEFVDTPSFPGSGSYYRVFRLGKFFHQSIPTSGPRGMLIPLPSYVADYSQPTTLLGATHNIFVGKVMKQVGNKDFSGNPATQFSVDVLHSIKGEIAKQTIVEQEGGYRNGVLYLIDSNPLIQSGSTYLFSTRYNAKENWHTMNPHPNASKLLSSDDKLTTEQLLALISEDPKVKELEDAYPHEILLDADIYHNNTRNSFQSLPPEKKAEAEARANEAKEWLDARTVK